MNSTDDCTVHTSDLPGFGQRLALRLLNLAGWRLHYKPLPGPRGVVVVYPHTSNWDFIVGVLGKWALGLPFRWLGKPALFKGPLGIFMRKCGGQPVVRSTATGATQRLAEVMLAEDWFWLALTPEGTRGYKPHWRSGFYHLAVAAKVPLLLVYLDYPNKLLSVVDTLDLTGEPDTDMAAIAAVCKGHHGLHPELEAPIVLAPRERA